MAGLCVNVNGLAENVFVYVSKVAADTPAKAGLRNMILQILMTDRQSAEQCVIEVKQILYCIVCARLILEVNEFVVDNWSVDGNLVSHAFTVSHPHRIESVFFLFSDEYLFAPCFYIIKDQTEYFSASVQWQSSD